MATKNQSFSFKNILLYFGICISLGITSYGVKYLHIKRESNKERSNKITLFKNHFDK